jgi:hypothetical protein
MAGLLFGSQLPRFSCQDHVQYHVKGLLNQKALIRGDQQCRWEACRRLSALDRAGSLISFGKFFWRLQIWFLGLLPDISGTI